MFINRTNYLNKLIERQNNGLIKVITGIRRSGKSFLLFHIYKDYLLKNGVDIMHIIELNFDNILYEEYHDAIKAYNFIKSKIVDDEIHYIFLDEVQLLNKFEMVLNSLLQLKNVDIYVTGSNAKFLSKDVITEFRGRGDQVHVYPLSFKEIYSINQDKNKYELLDEYINYGGIPLVLNKKTNESKTNYLLNLFKETYLSDIINRNNIINSVKLNGLINIISSTIGSLTNPPKLANTFKSETNVNISAPTISKYLECLTDSFLINRALKFDIKGKKYINSPSKYYFTDLGIRNAVLNFRQIEKTHLMENLIYNELLIRGYSVDVGEVKTIERDDNSKQIRKNLEIDFVCNLADKRIYIQSAFAMPTIEKYIQESKSLLSLNDTFKKVIITYDSTISHYTEDGIKIINIFDFLLNDNCFE